MLADLVDLEWLLRDGASVPDELTRAAVPGALAACAAHGIDAASARARVDSDRSLRAVLARGFVDVARARDPALPGRRVAHALSIAGVLLIVLGALLGVSTAQVVLAYDGKTPINVLHFVLVFCVTQIVLLALLVWFLLRSRHHAEQDGPAVMHRPIAWLVDRLLGKRGRDAAELLRALRPRHALYASVERWTLFALMQRFGVAFNVAALATTLLLVVGTDLVFSWSTTLDVSPIAAHRVADWLALPWSWCCPDAVPPLATVEASQWVRMPGAFVGERSLASAQPLAAQWWRFLVAGLIAWGLMPRTVALVLGIVCRRRALRSTGLDHAGFHVLFDRLLPVTSAWAGPTPESVRGNAPPVFEDVTATPHAPPALGASCALFAFGSLGRHAEALRDALTQRFAVDIRATSAVGGASLAADTEALAMLSRTRPQRAIVAFAAGQQPTADALAFVCEVRTALGASRPLVVVLAEPLASDAFGDVDREEHAIWRRSIGALRDAHLWLETIHRASKEAST